MSIKYYRFVFWSLWFVLVPVALAFLTVFALTPGEATAPDGLIGNIRWWIQDQKVPAIIVFFTLFEMVLYHFRHSLPLSDKVGAGGRPDVPRSLRKDFEHAGHLLEEARRVLKKNEDSIRRSITAADLSNLEESLDGLQQAMDAEPLDVSKFNDRYDRAATLVHRHLRRWQKGEAREYAESIVIAIGVALLLRAFVIEAFKIPSGSMLPTLQIQDHIFVNKFAYGPVVPFTQTRLFPDLPPERGDIMVFEYPDPNPRNERQDFIKRVIALPGDTLEVDSGHPIINGWRVPSCRVGDYQFSEGSDGFDKHGELFVEFLGEYAYLTLFEDSRPDAIEGPYTVKEGEVWVLGDNRNNSSDSRAWYGGRGGGVPFANIKGRAMFVWLSFDQEGVTWYRLLTNVMGKPTLPKEAPKELFEGIERCLQQRPEVTMPPAPEERRLQSLN